MQIIGNNVLNGLITKTDFTEYLPLWFNDVFLKMQRSAFLGWIINFHEW